MNVYKSITVTAVFPRKSIITKANSCACITFSLIVTNFVQKLWTFLIWKTRLKALHVLRFSEYKLTFTGIAIVTQITDTMSILRIASSSSMTIFFTNTFTSFVITVSMWSTICWALNIWAIQSLESYVTITNSCRR